MMTKEEFEKSLTAPVQFWSDKPREAVCMLLGEDVANMVGFSQRNPHHCYDLFMHSLHTVAGITETAPALLRVAAFFHDIGKLYVAEEKQGRLVFYGHAQKSAKIAEPILNQLGYSAEEREEVCFYISHHDDFISWVLPEEYDHDNKYQILITQENLFKRMDKVSLKMEENNFRPTEIQWKNLLILCYADVSAQAESVWRNGMEIDSKRHNILKVKCLLDCLHEDRT